MRKTFKATTRHRVLCASAFLLGVIAYIESSRSSATVNLSVHEQSASSPDQISATPASRRAKSHCSPCRFVSREFQRTPQSIEMTTGNSWGRTGNIYATIKAAMARAHACKTTLILPAKHAAGGLRPSNKTRYFDFSSRIGPAHPNCSNPDIGWGLSGDFYTFWELPELPWTSSVNFSFVSKENPAEDLIGCLQLYLGVCKEDFCYDLQHLQNKLVAHIRQGDIFKADYDSNVHQWYGQPPLSFYLTAMAYKKWDEVIILSEPTLKDVSPIFTAMEVLQQTGFWKVPISFQSLSWDEDFRTLMCAKNVVTSLSTLSPIVVDIGQVETFFHWQCFHSRKSIVQIAILGNYTPFQLHDNSPTEWVTTLLQKTSEPASCAELCATMPCSSNVMDFDRGLRRLD